MFDIPVCPVSHTQNMVGPGAFLSVLFDMHTQRTCLTRCIPVCPVSHTQNMVGPGEVDDDLQPEVTEECSTKYGEVLKCLIFEVSHHNFTSFTSILKCSLYICNHNILAKPVSL